MKHFIGIAATGILALAGCNNGLHVRTSDTTSRKVLNERAGLKQMDTAVVANINRFSFKLMDQIQSAMPTGENIFVSPLSVHMDLGMLLNGADGQTYTEIIKALDLEGLNLDRVNGTYAALIENLPVADGSVKLGLYNSVWYRKGLNISDSYVKTLTTSFQAKVAALDFKPTDAKVINNWASEKTNGKIPKVIDEIDGDQVMFLLNALYFKGSWATRFKKEKTVETDFHGEGGATSEVMMMNISDTFYHYIGSDYAAVRLPYGNGGFSMTIILPGENQQIGPLLSSFSDKTWTELQTKMKISKVRIGLPRFTIPDFEIKLNDILNKMGIQQAFNGDRADFTKMSTSKNLALSFVKQNSYLQVDEDGTEAAAVTTGGMVVTSMPMLSSIVCDHPFGFIISDASSNSILFMGRIMAPVSVD